MLLGDNSDATTIEFIRPATVDMPAESFVTLLF